MRHKDKNKDKIQKTTFPVIFSYSTISQRPKVKFFKFFFDKYFLNYLNFRKTYFRKYSKN